jgi:hypothetical protein
MKMPHMDTARSTQPLIRGAKRTVKMKHTLGGETKKWRPNGNDCWFAKTGTPAPSVYSARSSARSSRKSGGGGRATSRSSARGSRATSRSSRGSGTGKSRMSGFEETQASWQMSASDLWDRKLQLERQLEAVREEQDALMCEQIAKVNMIIVDNPAK